MDQVTLNPQQNTQSTAKVVDPNTLQFRRAVKDDSEAFSICKRLILDNTNRNNKAAAITRRYNDERPWSAKQLEEAGQSWRRNASTGFLSSLIKRITPQYKQIIDQARVLTFASLKGKDQKSDQKNEDFRIETTKTIRRWRKFHSFNSLLIIENVLHGYASAAFTDEWDWRPKFMRTDEGFFPEGCPQDAEDIPLWMAKQNFLIHELAEKISSKGKAETAKSVGWNIENLVNAINEAKPENRQRGDTEETRKAEDTVRETTMGQSFSEGVKVIEAYHLFAREPSGRVSHRIINKKDGRPLMTKLDRFESMDSCLRTFTIEVGNGKIHGSKGAGRMLYNTSIGVEQSRNLISDMLYLSGMLLFKTSGKGSSTPLTVQHPVGIVGEDYEVVQAQFKVNDEAFFALDRHFTQIGEMQAGAFMPGQLMDNTGKKKTASEVNYVASIEQQIKEGLLSRFWGQYLGLIHEMQKRIYSPENICLAIQERMNRNNPIRIVTKKLYQFIKQVSAFMGVMPPNMLIKHSPKLDEAVDSCINLLDRGLTPEEIFELAQCPPNEVTQDMAAQNSQAIDAIVMRYKGDNEVRQNQLKKRDIASKLGNAIAEELIIPQEDNTVMAEAVRMQLMETLAILSGDDVPVSPRDMDQLHLGTMIEKVGQLVNQMGAHPLTPEIIKTGELLLKHFDGHLQSAIGKGADPKSLGQFVQFSQMFHQMLGKGAAPGSEMKLPEGVHPAINPNHHLSGPNHNAPLQGAARSMPDVPVIPGLPGGKPLAEGPMNLQPRITS